MLERLIKEGKRRRLYHSSRRFQRDLAKITLKDGALIYTGCGLRYVDYYNYDFHSGKPTLTFVRAMVELLVNQKPVRCKSWANQSARLEPLVSFGGFGYANLGLGEITEDDIKGEWEVVE